MTVQQAIGNLDPRWRDGPVRAVTHLAEAGQPFHAFDVIELGVPDPDHPNRWGGSSRSCQIAGLIEAVAFRESRRQSRSGGVCRVWRRKTR